MKTEENSAYGLIISQVSDIKVLVSIFYTGVVASCLCIQLPPTTHEYDQVDALMGDTGFTMSTNTAYSVIHHPLKHQ